MNASPTKSGRPEDPDAPVTPELSEEPEDGQELADSPAPFADALTKAQRLLPLLIGLAVVGCLAFLLVSVHAVNAWLDSGHQPASCPSVTSPQVTVASNVGAGGAGLNKAFLDRELARGAADVEALKMQRAALAAQLAVQQEEQAQLQSANQRITADIVLRRREAEAGLEAARRELEAVQAQLTAAASRAKKIKPKVDKPNRPVAVVP
ncbi:MAG: hypothetical protein WCK65_00355 [Rhodospirillaceae bacterium]